MAVRVEGVVQGVGFRPFVYALATGPGLTGLVGNDLDGVFAEVEGPQAAVAEFLRRLERDAPPPRQPQLQLDSLTSTIILTFTWLIQASWLIWGPIVHRINRIARINHG